MDFDVSDDQRALRDLLRSFLARTAPEPEVRRVMESPSGHDPDLWRRLGAELGVLGLAVPEIYGGAGQGPVEVGVVAEELGRALTCVPFLPATMVTTALLASDDEAARRRHLPPLVAGELVATFALTESTGRWDGAGVRLTARETPDGWLLDGEKSFVPHGHVADLVLAVARAADGIGIFVVEAPAEGLTREQHDTLDPTRRLARLDFAGTAASRLQISGDGWRFVEHVLDHAAAVLAAEQVGVASWALAASVEYAWVRRQFGRPIGSFQAIKHQLADALLDVESARAAAYFALLCAERGEGLPAAASLAKAACSDACSAVTRRAVQVHGGIGFTWEHPAHLYLKRALGSAALLGGPVDHRERLARLVGI